MAITGTVTSAQGVLTLGGSLNDSITFTPASGSYTVEYPLGTVAIAASSSAQTLALTNGGQLRILCVSGSVAYSLAEVSDAWALNGPESVAARALVSQAGKSVMGGMRLAQSLPVPPTECTGGVAKSYDVQIPAKRSFYGVRLVMLNLNTAAAANYTAVRVGSPPKHLLSYGDEVTWSADLTTFAGATSVAVAAAVAGVTTNHVVEGISISDFTPIRPVARTDVPTGKPLLRARARCAAENQYVQTVNGSYPPVWNAYVGTTGLQIGSYLFTSDVVTSTPTDHTVTLTEGGGPMQPIMALFAYDDPGTQVWAFGDSLFQGVGSSVPAAAAGWLGWPTLVHIQQDRIDVMNMGVAGQKTVDSIAIMKRMVVSVADDLPSYAALKVYSPNDGTPTQALIDATWGRILEACSWLRTKGITPLLFTSPPVNAWTGTQHGFNEAQNARAVALVAACPWIKLVDMAAVVRDPANTRQILTAYNYDGTHYLDAGHQAIADAVVRVLAA